MILLLDIRNDGAMGAVIDARTARWFAAEGQRAGFAMLAKAKRQLGARRPSAIVVAVGAGEHRDVSWSAVRSGVATANALAFAWGVPAAEVRVTGEETREKLAALARKAAKKAPGNKREGKWVDATYSGEPHITVAKKVI